ncbi:IDEAL domain-containing protein [Brevibacillus daliensis]|uniref:IDEAL domain-containing protein n=1 Tax=Brevibacillus daliensis TaxID=2892995 RepID=UPI001E427975|nr:IDEAL domain-containing protein [Brevibacillus daliensis]
MEQSKYLGNGFMSGLLSEIMIDQQVRQFRKRTLYDEIDKALKDSDKEKFMVLTNELKELLSYEITETG